MSDDVTAHYKILSSFSELYFQCMSLRSQCLTHCLNLLMVPRVQLDTGHVIACFVWLAPFVSVGWAFNTHDQMVAGSNPKANRLMLLSGL